MQFKLKIEYIAGDTYLVGYVRIKPEFPFNGGNPIEVKLKRTASRPAAVTQEMEDCMKSYKKLTPDVIKKPKPTISRRSKVPEPSIC